MESTMFWITIAIVVLVIIILSVLYLFDLYKNLQDKLFLLDEKITDIKILKEDLQKTKEDLQKTKEDLDTRDQLFSDTLKEFSHTIGSEVGKTLLNYEQNNNIRMSGIDNRLKRVETRVGAVYVGVDLAKGPDMSTTSKITACDNPEFDTSDPEYAAAIKPKVIDGGTF